MWPAVQRMAGEIQFTIVRALVKLSDRLWPDSYKDLTEDGISAARADALSKAYRATDTALERGRRIAPQWCIDTAPGAAAMLDEFAR